MIRYGMVKFWVLTLTYTPQVINIAGPIIMSPSAKAWGGTRFFFLPSSILPLSEKQRQLSLKSLQRARDRLALLLLLLLLLVYLRHGLCPGG